jgi:starvation-inducible DNA-binding protein
MTHATKIDLTDNIREKAVALLNARLADVIDVKLQTKQAHWNVKGPSFIALHELFDEIAERVEGYVDLLAERVTTLGGTALGTVQVVSQSSKMTPYPLDIVEGVAHVQALSTVLASFGKAVRAAIGQADELGDADTADIFTEISRGIDKDLWFVEAHIQADR